MKEISACWHKLKGYMEAQKALMNRFYEQNKQLLTLVKQRNWLEMQSLMQELADLSCRIEAVEEKRHLCYQALLKEAVRGSDTPFSEMIAQLPPDLGNEFRSLKSSIALTAERISIENRTLDSYVESRSKTIQEILGELLPETRGALYGPKGTLKRSEIGTRSLVVDQSL